MSSQFARRAAISGTALAALLSGACKNSSSVTTPSQPAAIAPSNASNDQIGTVSKILGRPAEVVVTDASGNPVSRAVVTWTVNPGSGVITGSNDTTTFTTTTTTTTDSYGITAVIWELGPNPGTDAVTATTADGSTTTFNATARAATSAAERRTGKQQ